MATPVRSELQILLGETYRGPSLLKVGGRIVQKSSRRQSGHGTYEDLFRMQCVLGHDDLGSPSMHLYANGLLYCYGCGNGGDIVSFAAIVNQLHSSRAILRFFAAVQFSRFAPYPTQV